MAKAKAKLELEHVIGLTALHNAALAVNPVSGDIAFPAGGVIIIYRPRKNKQMAFLRARQNKAVSCLAFSKDGRFLAAGERGHVPKVNVWDTETKELVAEMHAHKFGVSCVAFSPNGKLLVSVGFRHDQTLNVWPAVWEGGNAVAKPATPKPVACSKVPAKVHRVAFSEDGARFVTAGERHVKFWYLAADGTVPPSAQMQQGVPVIDGRNGIIAAYKTATFTDVRCGVGANRALTYVVTSDGGLCCFGASRLMDRWLSLETPAAFGLCVTEKHVFTACAGGIVRAFDAGTMAYTATLPKPPPIGGANGGADDAQQQQKQQHAATLSVRISPAGDKLFTVYGDRSMIIWDVRNLGKVGKYRSFMHHCGCIWDIAVPGPDVATGALPRGTFVTCATDSTVCFWTLDRTKSSHEARAPEWKTQYGRELMRVVYVPDSAKQAKKKKSKSDSSLDIPRDCIVSKPFDMELLPQPPPEVGLRCVALAPDGAHVATGDRKGNLRVHTCRPAGGRASFAPVLATTAHDAEVLCLEYSSPRVVQGSPTSDGVLLVSGSRDRLAHVFDASSLTKDGAVPYPVLRTLDQHSSAITALKFDIVSSRLLSCGGDKSIVMSHVGPAAKPTITRYTRSVVPHGTIFDMDVDATNKFVVTAGQDKRLNIWNLATGKAVRHYKPEGDCYKVQLDPSGTYCATCCMDKCLRIFDFYSGQCASWARKGFIVAACHHTDGSSSRAPTCTGDVWFQHPPRPYDKSFRPRQVEQRARELLATTRWLLSSSGGGSIPSQDTNDAAIDRSRVFVAGFSYGSATAALATTLSNEAKEKENHEDEGEAFSFAAAVLLDGWFFIDMSRSAGIAFSFPAQIFANSHRPGLRTPSLFVNSEQFARHAKLYGATRQLAAQCARAEDVHVLPGTTHANFIDLVFWLPWPILRLLQAIGALGPTESVQAVQQMVHLSSDFMMRR